MKRAHSFEEWLQQQKQQQKNHYEVLQDKENTGKNSMSYQVKVAAIAKTHSRNSVDPKFDNIVRAGCILDSGQDRGVEVSFSSLLVPCFMITVSSRN